MTEEGHQVASLHGSKDATERDETIDAFRDGKCKVLITTNVIARGIDILQVNMVVNYDLPMTGDGKPDPETYLHRIGMWGFAVVARLAVIDVFLAYVGRTGRFGRRGISINFVHDKRTWEEMQVIQTALSKHIVRVQTEDFDKMEKVRSVPDFFALFSDETFIGYCSTGTQELSQGMKCLCYCIDLTGRR